MQPILMTLIYMRIKFPFYAGSSIRYKIDILDKYVAAYFVLKYSQDFSSVQDTEYHNVTKPLVKLLLYVDSAF
jgi:hypothetical protein